MRRIVAERGSQSLQSAAVDLEERALAKGPTSGAATASWSGPGTARSWPRNWPGRAPARSSSCRSIASTRTVPWMPRKSTGSRVSSGRASNRLSSLIRGQRCLWGNRWIPVPHADFCSWLKADLQSPEIEVRLYEGLAVKVVLVCVA